MKASDILMFNSTWECNPLVIREAASYGLKILARDLQQYLGMFDGLITPLTNDIKENVQTLISLINSEKVYTIEGNQSSEFASAHYNLYNNILSKKPMENIKNNSNINITQYFINQPFLEITGESDRNYEIKFFDEQGVCKYDNKIKSNHWVKLNREYFTKWNTKIWEDGNLIYDKTLDYKNKRVFINFDSKSLGDNIAWMPYVLEFQNVHECKVIVCTYWNNLFKKVYPELEFVYPGSTVPNIHGQYNIGWFYNENKEPQLPNTIPLQQSATNILGLPFKEIKPKISYKIGERPYKQKYVTIATNSTAGCKFWTKEAWQELINHLHSLGYKIINVSKEDNPFKNVSKIKDTSIENTMNVIHHSEFFIGLSSGLSWLAWAIGKHVVMISNFTEANHEFTSNCTRITNLSVCNGCWNNPNFKFDKGDWNWCPVHKGTSRQFECHTSITSEMVINQIKQLIK
jgi:autotransporter strand-loop-strand O-heptosyltransferase